MRFGGRHELRLNLRRGVRQIPRRRTLFSAALLLSALRVARLRLLLAVLLLLFARLSPGVFHGLNRVLCLRLRCNPRNYRQGSKKQQSKRRCVKSRFSLPDFGSWSCAAIWARRINLGRGAQPWTQVDLMDASEAECLLRNHSQARGHRVPFQFVSAARAELVGGAYRAVAVSATRSELVIALRAEVEVALHMRGACRAA